VETHLLVQLLLLAVALVDHHILALHHLVEDLNNLVVLAVDLVMELLDSV
jgi:hypothetical protein